MRRRAKSVGGVNVGQWREPVDYGVGSAVLASSERPRICTRQQGAQVVRMTATEQRASCVWGPGLGVYPG